MIPTDKTQKIMGEEYVVHSHTPEGRNPMEMIKVIEPHTRTNYWVSLEGAKAFKSDGAKFPLPEAIKKELVTNLGEDFVLKPKHERMDLIEQALLCLMKNYYGAEYLEEFDDSTVGTFQRTARD